MKKMLFILIPVLVLAQDYVLRKNVLSAGGRKMTSTDYTLQISISQTAIGNAEDTDYKAVFGFWYPPEASPPSAPYVSHAEKSGNDLTLTWNRITTDTLGNPETMHYYAVYRSTAPAFIPAPSDSIGAVFHPETTYTDAGALNASESYYYLVKAVDWARNRSKKSNMGYKFSKFFNENAGPTSDRNWVSLPWHNDYSTVSDLTTDLSPSGDPLVEITNLRDDQLYENYTYIPGFGWLGTDFTISSGRGYEMVTDNDTTLMLVGANNPDGLVNLNENPGAVSDRNWVSIPYNAMYSTVSDITDEYSPSGDPLIEVTNLRDDQLYENYTYIPGFGWLGTDFSISPGRGYEFVVNTDTTWNPTEYSNETDGRMLTLGKKRNIDVEVRLGELTESERAPVWHVEDIDDKPISTGLSKGRDYSKASFYKPVKKKIKREENYREPGISHVVYATLELKALDNFAFTVYRPDRPYDVLTENTVGSGIATKDAYGVVWFNVGNFRRPWHDGEEIVLVVEALSQRRGYFTVESFKVDKGVDIQEIGEISLVPIPPPEAQTKLHAVRWAKLDNDNIVGYSVYQNDERLNDKVIAEQEYFVQGDVSLRPVIKGGYETVYSSQGPQSEPQTHTPIFYAFTIYPNPFTKKTGINYALPHRVLVNIRVYDVSGRQVKTLVSEKLNPGYYNSTWYGDDDVGRVVSAGVYFIQMNTEGFKSQRKVIFVH